VKLTALLLSLISFLVPVQAQTNANPSLPQILTFVAPAYPRLASDSRIMGTTVTRIRIGKDGKVIEVNVVRAHHVFAKYVLSALKQWTFAPSEQESEFEVICRFEFVDEDVCVDDDSKPITPETVVSANLPTEVVIRTTLKCIVVNETTSDPVVR